MRVIGIRELRQQASQYLRDVAGGETLEVTDRGRPVAWIVPIPVAAGLEQLVATGRLTPADGDVLELGAPLAAAKDRPLPSVTLADIRSHEH